MLRWFCLWGDELPQSRLRHARSSLPEGAGEAVRFCLRESAKPHEKIHSDCIKYAYI